MILGQGWVQDYLDIGPFDHLAGHANTVYPLEVLLSIKRMYLQELGTCSRTSWPNKRTRARNPKHLRLR